jgi:hypothetical protein
MVNAVRAVVVHVGVVMLVGFTNVTMVRFVLCMFVNDMVHVISSEHIIVGRLVVAEVRMTVAKVGCSVVRMRMRSVVVVMLVPFIVRMVVAKMDCKVFLFLVFTWWLGSGEVLEEVVLAGRAPPTPPSPHDPVRILALEGE